MNDIFTQWSQDLIPVNISDELDEKGKKQVLPSPWRNGEQYKTLTKNSIALRTGKNSINVVDVDTKDFDNLIEPWKSWVEDRLMFGDCLTVETLNGYHFYFTCDFKVKTTTKKDRDGLDIPFIDFRGEGGLIFIHSTSKVASYKVISDGVMDDLGEIESLIPRYHETKVVESDGFTNLDDESDTETVAVSSGDKLSLDEVVVMINLTSANISRVEWLQLMASAYNLIDSEPNRLKEPLREWSELTAGEVDHAFKEDDFEKAWEQITSKQYGKDLKGGTLVMASKDGHTKKIHKSITKAKTVKKLKEIVEETSHIQSLNGLKSNDSEARNNLATAINLQLKELKKDNDKIKVLQARTIVKELQYAPTIEELEKNGEDIDLSSYYVGSKYRVRVGDKLSEEMAYSSAITHCGLLGVGEQIARAYLDRSSVISNVHIGADYNIERYVKYTVDKSASAHTHDILNVRTNPVFKLRRVLTDHYDEEIINDFFENIWQGKAIDLIKLTALSIRYKAEKKNQLMLVTPTSFGKTKMMKHLGFGEIGMETLLGAFQGDGIGSEVLNPIQSSGLMLINEVDEALPKRFKELENEMQVKEFGSGGGTRNVGLHFLVFTSTHDTAILKATDEVSERTMFMQLHAEDSKYNLTSSPIFNADRELYTNVVRNEMINQFLHYLYDSEDTKNDLYALQEKYHLHPSEDLHALSQDIFIAVVKAIKTQNYGTQNSRGEWVVTKKRDIRDLIESHLLDHKDIDVGKQVANITAQLYTGIKRKTDGITQYVVNLEIPVIDMFEDLDIENL